MRILTLVALSGSLLLWTQAGQAAQRDFYIVTVHIDGKTSTQGDGSHPAEAFPGQTLPSGGGIVVKAPDARGEWSMRAFVFEPSQVMVYQGDQEPLVLKRGEMKTVSLVADKVGAMHFRALNRAPTMHGQVIVLPRP
jgi:hypothetical protein